MSFECKISYEVIPNWYEKQTPFAMYRHGSVLRLDHTHPPQKVLIESLDEKLDKDKVNIKKTVIQMLARVSECCKYVHHAEPEEINPLNTLLQKHIDSEIKNDEHIIMYLENVLMKLEIGENIAIRKKSKSFNFRNKCVIL